MTAQNANPFSLDAILAPMSAPKFLKDYYGKTFVHIPGDPDKFPGVMDFDIFTNLLNMTPIWSSKSLEVVIDRARVDLSKLTFRLEDLSPLRILNRGFAAAYNQKNKLIKSPSDAQIGEVIRVRLSEGEIRARVLGEETQAVQENLFDLT